MLVVTGSDRTVKRNCFYALVQEKLSCLITFTMCRDGCKTGRNSWVKESDTNVFKNECSLVRYRATNVSEVSALFTFRVEIFPIFGTHSSFLWHIDYDQRRTLRAWLSNYFLQFPAQVEFCTDRKSVYIWSNAHTHTHTHIYRVIHKSLRDFRPLL